MHECSKDPDAYARIGKVNFSYTPITRFGMPSKPSKSSSPLIDNLDLHTLIEHGQHPDEALKAESIEIASLKVGHTRLVDPERISGENLMAVAHVTENLVTQLVL
ncbi:MAG TPA: hypothetical protein VF042_04965 [Gemmatimonadaceae bacterium]